jgi:hypothetical protein
VPTQPGALYGQPYEGVPVTLDGHGYDVPGLAFWAPNALLQNRAEREAIAADGDTEAVASFASLDETRIFLIRAVEDPWPEYQQVLDNPWAVGPRGVIRSVSRSSVCRDRPAQTPVVALLCPDDTTPSLDFTTAPAWPPPSTMSATS